MAMNEESWARRAIRYRNEFNRSARLLVGIATGLISDQRLTDDEIRFLDDWLRTHDDVAVEWPGTIICRRVRAILADGIITEEERAYLVATLQELAGAGEREALVTSAVVTSLCFDTSAVVEIDGWAFCLTGDFLYGPRSTCERAIVERGGTVKSGVSRRLHYLVVGSRGSGEWKHGSYGTKIDKAMQLKQTGAPIAVVKEDQWAAAL